MKVIYTKVVADLFHAGHVRFFKEARALGDRLVVQVVSDERVALAKRRPIMTQRERLAVVESCRYVDEATGEGPRVITLEFMVQNGYAVYAYATSGPEEAEGKLRDCPDLPASMVRILKYTEGISTTALLERIHGRHGRAISSSLGMDSVLAPKP
jgi:cytidyltransferase-like protein